MNFDVVVIGGGPAGLAAAIQAKQLGLSVALLDEQEQPGGQIYRSIERAHAQGRDVALGPDYQYGFKLVRAFRASKVEYLPSHFVWQASADGELFASDGVRSYSIKARRIVVAVGAMERPVPIPGWTLPGVMTVGAAQILMKTAGLMPGRRVWIAGNGPLVLAYAAQVVNGGGALAGILDTSEGSKLATGLSHLGGAMRGWRYVAKGMHYMNVLRRAEINIVPRVSDVEAQGPGSLRAIKWTAGGKTSVSEADALLLHEGVVPQTHMTQSLGCEHRWDDSQKCMRPVTDMFGATSMDTVFVAGDCGGIAGARVAEQQGRLAALGVWASLDTARRADRDRLAIPILKEVASHYAIRPMLEVMYRPRLSVLAPADAVTVCRCEGVTAGAIREAIAQGCRGPNQIKSYTRCGMGPCQGRMCGPTVTNLVAQELHQSPGVAGVLRIRPPLKPLLLSELASIATK